MSKIICASIHFDDDNIYPHQPKNIVSGFVLSGHRHCNCIANLVVFNKRMSDYKIKTQGFLTSDNRFVDRKEAMIIAKRENQLINKTNSDTLFSEDLY